MTFTIIDILLCVVAYLTGSIPFGLLVGRAKGIDIRKFGSGNIGATNVARAIGKKWGVLVMILDASKGALPVMAALSIGSQSFVPFLAGLLAIMGHVAPIWLKFKGGKGVATSLGVFVAFAPLESIAALLFWLLVYAISRLSSLASLLAAFGLSLAMSLGSHPIQNALLAWLGFAIIVVRHRSNILRLFKREEQGI